MQEGRGMQEGLHLHRLVSMCHHHLLVVTCRGSLSLVSWSSHHRVLSLPHTVIALSPCIVVTPRCQVVVVLCHCHVIIVLIACLHRVLGSPWLNITCVHSSLSCVSAKWVGMNVGRGVLTMVSEINSNDE